MTGSRSCMLNRVSVVLGVGCLLVAACSGGGSSRSSSTPQNAPSADAIVQAFLDAQLPVAEHVTFTAGNDTNHQLGRPGQYNGKASWHDSRVSPFTHSGDTTGIDFSDGGTVETFASNSDRDQRANYLKGFASTPP